MYWPVKQVAYSIRCRWVFNQREICYYLVIFKMAYFQQFHSCILMEGNFVCISYVFAHFASKTLTVLFFKAIFWKMFEWETALEDKDRISLWSKEQVCLECLEVREWFPLEQSTGMLFPIKYCLLQEQTERMLPAHYKSLKFPHWGFLHCNATYLICSVMWQICITLWKVGLSFLG